MVDIFCWVSSVGVSKVLSKVLSLTPLKVIRLGSDTTVVIGDIISHAEFRG